MLSFIRGLKREAQIELTYKNPKFLEDAIEIASLFETAHSMQYRTHGEAEKGPKWVKQAKTQEKGKQPKWSKTPQQQWTPPKHPLEVEWGQNAPSSHNKPHHKVAGEGETQ